MVQELTTIPNIFGRLGKGFGQGLAEQIPKEVERSRLESGLKQLGDQKGLSPFQQFAGLASTPGVTPQMIQSGSDLLRQQARGQALAERNALQNAPKPNPFQNLPAKTPKGKSKIPSLTKEEILAKVQEGYIRPTIEERDEIAGELYNSNPGFFGNDPERAIAWANEKIAQEEKIASDFQNKHANLTTLQDNVVRRLKDQYDRLNGGSPRIPAELYTKIEDKAIQATKPISEGGRGLTEHQASKEYSDELNNAERDFSKIEELGGWGVTLRPASESLRSMKELQRKMESLDQTDNYAKRLISTSQVSPMFGYAIAEPVSRVPLLNSYLKNLPLGKSQETIAETVLDIPGTLKIAPKLAKIVKENEKASPLAIAYELEKKGYDPKTWLQYVTDHGNELNLRQRQAEQASTPINVVSPWNDWWLSSFTGIE